MPLRLATRDHWRQPGANGDQLPKMIISARLLAGTRAYYQYIDLVESDRGKGRPARLDAGRAPLQVAAAALVAERSGQCLPQLDQNYQET
jgi:hypothetical protein